MSTITKERLTELSRRENVGAILGEEIAELARIALASLEAEAVACIDRANLDYLESGADADVWPASGAGSDDVLLYAAPQLPQPAVEALKRLRSIVADPKTLPRRKEWISGQQYSYVLLESVEAMVDDACRAAMLQGTEPVQGWIPCSDRMPTKNDRVLIFINFNSDTVPPSIHDAQFTGSTFRRGNATVNVFPLEDGYGVTHWMPLPVAPQQEVK